MDQVQLTQFLFSFAQTTGILAAVATAASLGMTEFAKKAGLSTKFAAIFSALFSIVICVLVIGILTGSYFSPLTVLTSLVAVFAPSSIYSAIAALKKPKE